MGDGFGLFVYFEKFEDTHFRNGFSDIEIECHSCAEAYRSDPESIFAKAVVSAMYKLYGGAIIHHTLAGTTPMPVLCKADNIPVASFGGTSIDANAHAPNEFVYVESYIDEIKMDAAVMKEISML